MKQKYGNENWSKDKPFPQQAMSVKEALRLLIVSSLEKQMVMFFGCSHLVLVVLVRTPLTVAVACSLTAPWCINLCRKLNMVIIHSEFA
jgi:hypothetical protein